MRADTRYIVVHCTAGGANETVESVLKAWKDRGWKSVGYHVIIEKDGNPVHLADASAITNGVRGHNYHAYHICWMGGRDGDDRTIEQKVTLMNEILWAMEAFPNAEVVGHRDLSPDLDGDGVVESHEWLKLCPQFDVKEFVEQVEQLKDFKEDIIKKAFGTH
jgi:N-acetyl-anhydromuramyl-L-alanine amidase AmpD